MTTTPRLGITEMAETQNNREVTVNEAFAKLEAGATFYAAIQVLLNTPPVSPAEGDLYVVGTAGTGVWSGHNKNVTVYYNAAWLFFAPFEGMFAWDQTSDSMKRYDGSAWVAFTATGASVADADYGDISVSGGGAAWTIDNDVVTNAKAANMAQSTIKGRAASAGTGDPTDLTVAQVVAIIGDTDGTLAANSDSVFATQKAAKTYADALIAASDAMVFKGVIDCSANPNYPAADRGHQYRASVAGKIGGVSGVNVEVGDMMLCLTDGTASGNQATVGTAWSIIQTNLDGAVINTRQVISGAGLTGGGDLSADRTLAVGAGTGMVVNADDVAIDKATAANVWAAASNKVLTADIIFTAADPVTLTDATTIAVDMSTFLNAKVTLGGNRTLGAPSNPKNGQSGCIEIIQDGTGTRTLAYHADWLFAGGTDPVLSTAAGTKDLLFYQVMSNGKTYANLVKAIA